MFLKPCRQILPFLLTFSCCIWAGEARTEFGTPIELPDIKVVTAARSEQDSRNVTASVSVITRQEIQRSAAEDLLELLRLQAGVDIVRSGPAGSQTSVFLRGGNSDHLLVLIDGVRVASAHTGTYTWELLPLAQIERIEIVRGPRAALYGSDAIGGVIQVFTRQLDGPVARLTVGSYGTTEAEAGLSAKHENSTHSLTAAWRKSNGFSSQNPNGYSHDPDDDGFDSRSAGASGEIGHGDGAWKYRVLASESETEFDQGVSEARQWLANISWHGRASDDWTYQIQAGYFDEELESDYLFFATGFDSTRLDLSWQNQLELPKGSLGFGIDFVDDEGQSDGNYQADRDNRAIFAVWDLPTGKTNLQVGARFDDNSQFGREWTWQAAASFLAGQSSRLSAQFGTAFRAPDLGEQFSPGFGGFFAGNPNLQPETSQTFELNYRFQSRQELRYSVAAYHTEVEQLIAFTGENFQAINISRAALKGVEAEVAAHLGGWILRANATFQETEDKTTGERLLRRPDRKGSITLDRTFENGSWAGLDWFMSGTRLDVGSQTLPGYGILSLRGGWSLGNSVGLELRLENLLDKEYEPAAGFNSAGRSAFLSLDWRP